MAKEGQTAHSAKPTDSYPGEYYGNFARPLDERGDVAPLYYPGSKIPGARGLKPRAYLTNEPTKTPPVTDKGILDVSLNGSSYREPVNRLIDLAWRGLGELYGPEHYPGLIELPKPERFYQLIDIAARAFEDSYPDFQAVKPEQIQMRPKPEFEDLLTRSSNESNNHISIKRLISLGMNVPPLELKRRYYLVTGSQPLQMILNEQAHRALSSGDPDTAAFTEFNLMLDFLQTCVFQSKDSKIIPYSDRELVRIFSRRLDYDLRTLPKLNPNINILGLKEMVAEYRKMISITDGNPSNAADAGITIQTLGAAVTFIKSTGDRQNPSSYDQYMSAGVGLTNQIDDLVISLPLQVAVNELSRTYPSESQRSVQSYFHHQIKQVLDFQKAKIFLSSIGLVSGNDIATAHFRGEIPELYLAAKQKRKNLEYPVE